MPKNYQSKIMKAISKKILISLCLSFCCAVVAFPQDNIREMVCIVRPKYSVEINNFFSDYGRLIAREGYIRAGALLRSLESGGFGSGVVVLHNGKHYVLTNHHVINRAHSVSIEFSEIGSDDGKRFDNCRIVASDSDYDLALIELPADAVIKGGFSFSAVSLMRLSGFSSGYSGLTIHENHPPNRAWY